MPLVSGSFSRSSVSRIRREHGSFPTRRRRSPGGGQCRHHKLLVRWVVQYRPAPARDTRSKLCLRLSISSLGAVLPSQNRGVARQFPAEQYPRRTLQKTTIVLIPRSMHNAIYQLLMQRVELGGRVMTRQPIPGLVVVATDDVVFRKAEISE